MELEKQINILGFFVVVVLGHVTEEEFEGKEWDFIYGIDEHTKDYKKIKKQLKRLLWT